MGYCVNISANTGKSAVKTLHININSNKIVSLLFDLICIIACKMVYDKSSWQVVYYYGSEQYFEIS